MKHHITTIIAFSVALLLQVSCYDLRFGDAFLGEHPESSGATLDTLFSSAANAERVLTKAYSYLPYGLPTGKDNGHAYDKLGLNILESITDLNHSTRNNPSDGPLNLYYNGLYGSNIPSGQRGLPDNISVTKQSSSIKKLTACRNTECTRPFKSPAIRLCRLTACLSA